MLKRNMHITSSVARQCGFTLVELLAAMLFMGIVLPVAIGGVVIANRAGVIAERSRIAAQLADKQLSEAVITETWMDGDASGDFGEEFPGYSWRQWTENWEEASMVLVKVEVSFMVQAQTHHVELSTLVQEVTE